MKKSLVGLIGLALFIGVLFLIFYLWAGSVYDKTVNLQETVDQEWADVQSAYQRRADLLPNLAATVKNAAKTEGDILIEVTRARGGIAEIKQDINNAQTPEQIQLVGGRISRGFNLMVERYPEIKSIQNYQQLQSQIEGTENRINVAREDYNASVKNYNSQIRGFFRKQALSMTEAEGDNFVKREMFEAKEGSDEVPNVDELLN